MKKNHNETKGKYIESGGRIYPHMCRMDHEEVGYAWDHERCPVCYMMDERDWAQEELERIKRALEKEWGPDWASRIDFDIYDTP